MFFLLFGCFMGYVGLCHARALLSGQNLIRFGLKKGHLITAAVIWGFFVLAGDRPGSRSAQSQPADSQSSPDDSAQQHSAVRAIPDRQFAPGQRTDGSTAPFFASGDVLSERPAAHDANTKTSFIDEKDKVSYAIGMNISRSMKQEGLEINPDALAAALTDVLAGTKPQLPEDEVKAVMEKFQRQLTAKQMAVREEGFGKNKAEGAKFLADNKKKKGVKATASGLQYTVIKDGIGRTPKATDTVKTHYRGTFINGTEFDSSYKRGEPAEFPVNGVIHGWTEALQLMKEGAKWQLFIPSELAYGERGAGKDIGPNSTLIFEIELISVSGR